MTALVGRKQETELLLRCWSNAKTGEGQVVLLSGEAGIGKSHELRACTSLAYLWLDQGKRNDARDLVEPTYSWFTEGFDTPGLKQAKALLHNLQ